VKIDNRQKLLAIVAIGCLALLACDRLIITPLIHTWKDRDRRISELSERFVHGTTLLDRENSIRERWAEMQSNTLPSNVSVAESKVLKSVDQWTQDSGISFTSIKPQWKQNADDCLVLECQASAFGDIQALTRFLYDLERDPLALKVEDVEIAARDDNGQQLSLGVRFTGLVLTGDQQ